MGKNREPSEKERKIIPVMAVVLNLELFADTSNG